MGQKPSKPAPIKSVKEKCPSGTIGVREAGESKHEKTGASQLLQGALKELKGLYGEETLGEAAKVYDLDLQLSRNWGWYVELDSLIGLKTQVQVSDVLDGKETISVDLAKSQVFDEFRTRMRWLCSVRDENEFKSNPQTIASISALTAFLLAPFQTNLLLSPEFPGYLYVWQDIMNMKGAFKTVINYLRQLQDTGCQETTQAPPPKPWFCENSIRDSFNCFLVGLSRYIPVCTQDLPTPFGVFRDAMEKWVKEVTTSQEVISLKDFQNSLFDLLNRMEGIKFKVRQVMYLWWIKVLLKMRNKLSGRLETPSPSPEASLIEGAKGLMKKEMPQIPIATKPTFTKEIDDFIKEIKELVEAPVGDMEAVKTNRRTLKSIPRFQLGENPLLAIDVVYGDLDLYYNLSHLLPGPVQPFQSFIYGPENQLSPMQQVINDAIDCETSKPSGSPQVRYVGTLLGNTFPVFEDCLLDPGKNPFPIRSCPTGIFKRNLVGLLRQGQLKEFQYANFYDPFKEAVPKQGFQGECAPKTYPRKEESWFLGKSATKEPALTFQEKGNPPKKQCVLKSETILLESIITETTPSRSVGDEIISLESIIVGRSSISAPGGNVWLAGRRAGNQNSLFIFNVARECGTSTARTPGSSQFQISVLIEPPVRGTELVPVAIIQLKNGVYVFYNERMTARQSADTRTIIQGFLLKPSGFSESTVQVYFGRTLQVQIDDQEMVYVLTEKETIRTDENPFKSDRTLLVGKMVPCGSGSTSKGGLCFKPSGRVDFTDISHFTVNSIDIIFSIDNILFKYPKENLSKSGKRCVESIQKKYLNPLWSVDAGIDIQGLEASNQQVFIQTPQGLDTFSIQDAVDWLKKRQEYGSRPTPAQLKKLFRDGKPYIESYRSIACPMAGFALCPVNPDYGTVLKRKRGFVQEEKYGQISPSSSNLTKGNLYDVIPLLDANRISSLPICQESLPTGPLPVIGVPQNFVRFSDVQNKLPLTSIVVGSRQASDPGNRARSWVAGLYDSNTLIAFEAPECSGNRVISFPLRGRQEAMPMAPGQIELNGLLYIPSRSQPDESGRLLDQLIVFAGNEDAKEGYVFGFALDTENPQQNDSTNKQYTLFLEQKIGLKTRKAFYDPEATKIYLLAYDYFDMGSLFTIGALKRCRDKRDQLCYEEEWRLGAADISDMCMIGNKIYSCYEQTVYVSERDQLSYAPNKGQSGQLQLAQNVWLTLPSSITAERIEANDRFVVLQVLGVGMLAFDTTTTRAGTLAVLPEKRVSAAFKITGFTNEAISGIRGFAFCSPTSHLILVQMTKDISVKAPWTTNDIYAVKDINRDLKEMTPKDWGAPVVAEEDMPEKVGKLPEKFTTEIKESQFAQAVRSGDTELVNQLLEQDLDMDVDSPVFDNKKTPLHYAAFYGYPAIVEALISRGANVNAKDNSLFTPLHWAATEGHGDVISLLLKNNADVNATNKEGKTPLHLAAEKGNSEIVGLLLGAPEVDPSIQDKDGKTPLTKALEGDHAVAASLLQGKP